MVRYMRDNQTWPFCWRKQSKKHGIWICRRSEDGKSEKAYEDSFDGTVYIKLCGTSCPYDGEYCASDECPVLNEIAEKLARYERMEEQNE